MLLLGVAPLLLGAFCGGGGGGSNLPDLDPFTADEEDLLHGIRDEAASMRGLEINPDTTEGTLTRDQLTTYIDDEYSDIDESDLQEVEVYNDAYRLLHMIGPDDDLLEAVKTSDSQGILGFFVPDENSLVLIADPTHEINPYDEMILAHEYIHSFQHYKFDLNKLDKLAEDETNDDRTEYSTTVDCLEEGDASVGMLLFMEDRYGPSWRDQLPADEEDAPDEPVPPAIERYMAFDYSECVRFVQALYDDGGWAAVDRAYANPPTTTEQILHPRKYLDGEASRSGAPASLEDGLGDGWSLLETDPFGEFDVYNYVVTILGDEAYATAAAAGWGSGWVSVYNHEPDGAGDNNVLVHLRLDWDTSRDFNQFMLTLGDIVNVVAPDNWNLDMGAEVLRWDNSSEHAYVTWSEALNRVEMVISSDSGARDSAAALVSRR